MFKPKLVNNKIIYGIILLLGLVAAVFIWNNYQIQITEKPKQPVGTNCGIENCHGLNITCGPKVPEVCDMSYQLGDKCRQLAQCQTVGGSCQLIKSVEFSSCKSCAENCDLQFKNEPEKAFSCEAKCGPQVKE
ncbi:MAG: hypothetical protein V1858_02230 [Candidatus Gottesmanbacteria bacterium]